MGDDQVGRAIYSAEFDTSKVKSGAADAKADITSAGKAAESAFSGSASAGLGHFGGLVDTLKGKLAGLGAAVKAPEVSHGILQGVGLGAGLLAFQGVEEVVGKAVDAVKEFAADAEAAQVTDDKLTQSLKDNVPGWQQHTDEIERAVTAGNKLGFTDNALKDSLAQLVTHTGDVSKALELQNAAMDLSRLKGLDLDTTTKLMGKAFDGNVGALAKYGIAVKKGATETQILAAIQKSAGGQAETYASTVKGQQAALDAEAEHARVRIGEGLMPLMRAFTAFLAGPVMDAINAIIDGLGNLGDAFNNLHRFLDPSLAAQQDLEKALRDGAEAAGLDGDAVVAFAKKLQDAKVIAEGGTGALLGATAAAEGHAAAVEAAGGAQDAAAHSAFAYAGALGTQTAWQQAAAKGQLENTTTLWQQSAAIQQNVTDLIARAKTLSDAKSILEQYTASLVTAGDTAAAADTELMDHVDRVAATQAQGAIRADAWGTAQRSNAIEAARSMADAKNKMIGSFAAMQGGLKSTLKQMTTDAKTGMADLTFALRHPLAAQAEENYLLGRLQSQKLAKGLASNNPEVHGTAVKTMNTILAALNQLDPVKYGTAFDTSLANGLDASKNAVGHSAAAVAKIISDHLRIQSPAKLGPLSEGGGPEGWGLRFGSLYRKGAAASLAGFGGDISRSLAGATGLATGAVGVLAMGGGTQTIRHEFSPLRIQVDGRNLPAGVTNEGLGAAIGRQIDLATVLNAAERTAHVSYSEPRRYG